MNVLSLFDGISCGRIALEKAGHKITSYYASEVDKYAIQIANKNYPDTIHIGDVRNINITGKIPFDLLIGGSPCQGFSVAGKGLNFEDPRSKLFFEYARILKALKKINPEIKFLLENVRMKKEWRDIISNELEVQPVVYNSILFGAQERLRYYWTNWGLQTVMHPVWNKIFAINDVVEEAPQPHTFFGAMRGRYLINGVRQDGKMKTAGLTTQRIEMRYDGKSNNLSTVLKDNVIVYNTDGRKYYSIYECDFRFLSPLEYERLQGLPQLYTLGISTNQRYRLIGNGWQIDTLKHIFRQM